jgi:hypothetical protein
MPPARHPAVLVPGGGVVEGGAAARHMQAEVRRIAIANGIALLGPNCMGVVDLTTNSATYIGDVNPWQRRGGVAGIAQSGSVTDAFIHSGARIGFSRIVSCGAEVVLDVCDYLAYCLDDPETHAVILFVDKRPERFLARRPGARARRSRWSRSALRGAGGRARALGLARGRGSRPMRSPRPASSAVATSTSCSRRPSCSTAATGCAAGWGRGGPA